MGIQGNGVVKKTQTNQLFLLKILEFSLTFQKLVI